MALASVQTAGDATLVAAARAGDRQAFAVLYERYFDAVYNFAARMTRDRQAAAGIAHDTFLQAINALGGLKANASFESWTFALARKSTLDRLQRAASATPIVFQGEQDHAVPFDAVDAARFPRAQEEADARALAPLVWTAAARLDPEQLSVLVLHLQQGLDSAEIAYVLGVSKHNGSVVLNRLKETVEKAFEAYIVLRDRNRCDRLDAALEADGIVEHSPGAREAVQAHFAKCRQCDQRRRRMVRPLAVFGAFVPVSAPPTLKSTLLAQLMAGWPGPSVPDAGAASVESVTTASDGQGPKHGRVLNAALGLGTFALVILALIVFTPLNLARNGDDSGDGLPGLIDIPTPTPHMPGSPGPTDPTTPGSTNGTPTPRPDDEVTPTTPSGGGASTPGNPEPTDTPAPTSTGTITATPTSTPTRTPTATPTPCLPQLDDNVNGILNLGAQSAASFIVFNFSPCEAEGVSVSANQPWLSVSPVDFDIGPTGAAGNRTIMVTVNRAGLQPGQQSGVVTVNPPSGPSVTVVVSVTGPTPTPTPTNTATPTATPSPPPDTLGPELSFVSCTISAGEMTVVAHAADPSGLAEVEVSFVDGPAFDLGLSAGTTSNGNWSASFPDAPSLATGFLSARDSKGNPATTVAFTRDDCD